VMGRRVRGQSVRRTYPHGRDDLSATGAQCPDVFDGVLPRLLWGDSSSLIVTTNTWLARHRAAVHLMNGYHIFNTVRRINYENDILYRISTALLQQLAAGF